MGLVEAAKLVTIPVCGRGYGLGVTGLGAVTRSIGAKAEAAIRHVYGSISYRNFLEGAWRKGPAELETALRNGLRLAVFSGDAKALGFVADFGHDPDAVAKDVATLREGKNTPETAAARERIARLEAAVDARGQAAVASGRDQYVAGMQFAAMVVSIAGCLVVRRSIDDTEPYKPEVYQALLIGLLAVPIAPVAKDLVAFLNSLRTAFAKRGTAA
jgi:hypothetical protein